MKSGLIPGLLAAAGFAVACNGSGDPLLVDDPCWQSPVGGGAPLDLRCTGLYEDWAARRISPDARAFAPGTPLWSDGARKQRWIHLPPGTIDASNPDEWVFPVGTKAWKEFSLGERRIETRLFEKVAPSRWIRATYVWSADGSSAGRYDRGVSNFEGTGYSIPSVSDCDKCHEGRLDRLLGFEAFGLGEPKASGLTLPVLIQEARITSSAGTAGMLNAAQLPPALSAPTRAALSWMHSNCGTSCHNRAADSTGMATKMFLRLETAQLAQAASGSNAPLDPVSTTVGIRARTAKWSGSLRVSGGAPLDSLLFRLATSRGPEQMPPILSHLPDPEGTRVLREWINSLPSGFP